MQMASFFVDYIIWHYSLAFADIAHISSNFLKAISELFSLRLLARTFFQPIFRLHETYAGGLNFEDFGATIVANVLMRFVGMIIRTIFICIGLISLVIFSLLSLLFYVVWAFMPFVIIGCLVASIKLLFP